MNLITPYEVLKYSPAGMDYPIAQFCDLIPDIEQEFARECLGNTLYEYFVGKLTPYPDEAKEWDKKSVYGLEDVVIRNGCLFVSEVACNETDPLKETGDWSPFERFIDDHVNTFWKTYLRRILALKVYMASLIFTTWRGGSGGLTIASGDSAGIRAANKGEMSDVKTGLIAEIERTTQNMRFWIRDKGADAGFPSSFICNQFCETPGRKQRRWAFRN